MKSIQSLRGTKDIIGAEARLWEAVESAARGVLDRFGFEPIRLPLIEESRLFKQSVGEVTDIVQKEMYQFLDRSETEIALRPEGTASVVRAYVENHLGKERPVSKFFYYGPMFRAERPQAGRQRQFHQIGAETFGSASAYSDAESIEALVRVLEALGVRGYTIEVNNLGDAPARTAFSEMLRDYLKTTGEDKLCADCRVRASKNVFRILDCKNPGCQAVIEGAPRISDHVSAESRETFEAVRDILAAAGITTRHNPRIVRGLDYYTHTVFELRHPALGSQDALAAGGRYDTLVEKLGGDPTPAVGFALGVERLILAVQQDNPEFGTSARAAHSVSVLYMGQAAKREAWKLVSQLRREGLPVQMDFEDRSLKAQMRQADRAHSRFSIIIGDDEIKNGTVMFKDMSRAESGVPLKRDQVSARIQDYREIQNA